MTKTRLTNLDREAIRVAILNHKFDPLDAASAQEEAALALVARRRACGDYLSVMEGAPDGAFPTSGGLRVNVGGKAIWLRFGADPYVSVRMFSAHTHAEALTLTESDKLGAKIMAWAERREKVKRERQDLGRQLAGTLAAFRNFEDVQRDWPEAERFVTERLQSARPGYIANVPAIQLHDLSAALDLPPETQAVAA